ncbi:MAG: DEAD/DEAH box helicase, partial [Dehalococcoidales bacterium]|nr:DEAD/DEAH box helicase [Dehalococcoidales bacterium]
LMLPPGFERKALTFISLRQIPVDFDLSSLTEDQRHAFELVKEEGRNSQKKLEKILGQKKARRIISQLVGWGLVERSYELEPIKAKPKVEFYIKLAITADQARLEIAGLEKKRARKQAALLSFLTEQSEFVSLRGARQRTKCDRTVVDALVQKGFITVQQFEVRRDSLATRAVNLSFPLTLTSDQALALQIISQSLRQEQKVKPKVLLLHGVTGSGKTEVYLQSLAEAVKLGKRGIVLVPEISLTPQTIERFASRFAGRVAVLHSRLSFGERFDEWQRIRNGKVDVVIGPRSAVFAPQPDLGLIILDEEHEWSYKQSDISPRYHARDVAIKLAEL